jgi:hypothetical protein
LSIHADLAASTEDIMKNHLLIGAALAGSLALALPAGAQTRDQGIPPGVGTGAATGAVGGAIVGGPVGAVVGGAAGAIVGGLAETTRPQFREYVVERRHTSFDYDGEVAVGRTLPDRVTYYEVPDRFGQTEYRYTVVNNRTVLVEPRTRRIVQIID